MHYQGALEGKAIRPNEDGKMYNFAHTGRRPGNPGHFKSEAAAYPSEPLPRRPHPGWAIQENVVRSMTFDLAAFLATAGVGRRIVQLKPRQAFFSQGSSADSI